MENGLIPQFSVSDFLAVVNQSLDMAFGSVFVEGEVSSFKVNHQKYVFFDLKDENGSVGCFMTVWQLRVPIEDGMRVVARVAPKVTPWGKFSLTVTELKPVGEGSLKKSLEILRAKLSKEGLFDSGRKRRLPYMPELVGVISSTGAAGYADFIKIADDQFGGTKFLVANVQVQGSDAPDQIIRAIEHFNQLPEPPEVLVIVRGGGSADDLSAFNDELLVRAIAASRVPVLTGIGHEVDESLSDLAADVAASTPTNAAQILLPDRRVVLDRLRAAEYEVVRRMADAATEGVESVRQLRSDAILAWSAQIDETYQLIARHKALISEYNPVVVLERGYALLTGRQEVGELLTITTKDAVMKARIEQYEGR